jgi:bacillithiol biosynthesis deacetylase BshB1
MTKLDILAFGAHPDDVEISAGGSIIRSVEQGKQVGIVDLTRGELGSRGNADLRDIESKNSSKVLGIQARGNLNLQDGFFEHTESSTRAIIETIRHYRPNIVLAPAPSDRHPDHGRASKLVREACFYSGLLKIETSFEGKAQEAWRPKAVYCYIQDYYHKPDFVVDVTHFWDKKMTALLCYSSQFYQPGSDAPKTPISGSEFFDFLKGRAMQVGRPAGFLLGEGFIADRTIGINDFDSLI